MKALPAIIAALTLIIVLGCGGTQQMSVFAGNWSGSWVYSDSPGQTGALTLNVTSIGTASGQVRFADGFPGTVIGTIDNAGNVNFGLSTVNAPPDPTTLKGKLTLSQAGRLAGVLTAFQRGAVIYTVSIDIARA